MLSISPMAKAVEYGGVSSPPRRNGLRTRFGERNGLVDRTLLGKLNCPLVLPVMYDGEE